MNSLQEKKKGNLAVYATHNILRHPGQNLPSGFGPSWPPTHPPSKDAPCSLCMIS